MMKVFIGMANNGFKARDYQPCAVFSNIADAYVWANANNGYVQTMTVFDSYAAFKTAKDHTFDLTKLAAGTRVKLNSGAVLTIKHVSEPTNDIVSLIFEEYAFTRVYYTDGTPYYTGIDDAIVSIV